MKRFFSNLAEVSRAGAFDEAEVLGFGAAEAAGGARRFSTQFRNFVVAWSRVLDPTGRERLRSLLAALPESDSMRCHMPPFGLRLVRGGVETRVSVCFECHNAYVETVGAERELYAFDAGSDEAKSLLTFLREGAPASWRAEGS